MQSFAIKLAYTATLYFLFLSITNIVKFKFEFSDETVVTDIMSGVLTLPDGDGFGLAASDVTIQVAPVYFNLTLPLDAFSLGGVTVNSFNVVGGNIVDAFFQVTDGSSYFTLSGPSAGTSSDLNNDFGAIIDFNYDSTSLTFIPVDANVPLPAGGPLLLMGIAGLAALRRKTKV